MRQYASIAPRFWNGPTGRAIRAAGRDVQVMALYLFTGPSATMIGLYYLPMPTLCHEAGYTEEEARAALSALSKIEFAYYDEASELVWVPAAAKYQIGDELKPGDHRIKGIERSLTPFLEHKFGREFLNRYKSPYSLSISKKGKPLPRPSQAPPKPGTGTGTGTGEPPTPSGGDVVAVFEHWKTVMGHPSAKLTAGRERRIKGRLSEGYSVPELREAVDGCRRSLFHMGANETKTVYDDVSLICRSGEKVEFFRAKVAGSVPRQEQRRGPWEAA